MGEPQLAVIDVASNAVPPLRSLAEAAAELTGPLSIERIAAVVAAAAEAGLGADALVIAVREPDGRHLRGVHARRLPREARQRLSSISADGPSLLAEVARSGRAVYLLASAQAILGARLGGGPHAIAVTPIPAPERPLGVMVLSRSAGRVFSADDRAFLDALAGLCALAVERARLSADRSRVRALLRRGQLALHVAGTQLRIGSMLIDLEQQRIVIGDRAITLTPSEIRLLTFLAEEPGRPRTRHEILRHLWHTDHVGDVRACDAHISNLRRKIERDASRPELVVTLRGVGYALQVP